MADCDWQQLADEFADDLRETQRIVGGERDDGVEIHPPEGVVFRALELTPCPQTKVVIVGQDPYHGAFGGRSQADGLCFSVQASLPIPPSLRNIRAELRADLPSVRIPDSGSLEPWARRGVLLLNAILTVRGGVAGSHRRIGWETFTDQIIQVVNDKPTRVVFMLWGGEAQDKASFVDESRHSIICSSHPAPLAAHRPCRGCPPFLGSRPFSRANEALRESGQEGIDWNLD